MRTAGGQGSGSPYSGEFQIRFGEFMQLVQTAPLGTLDLYLAAQSRALHLPAFASLWHDLKIRPPWFTPERARLGTSSVGRPGGESSHRCILILNRLYWRKCSG